MTETDILNNIEGSLTAKGNHPEGTEELPIDLFASIVSEEDATVDRGGKISQILDNNDLSECVIPHKSESGRNTLRINKNGRALSQEIAEIFLDDEKQGLVELVRLRESLAVDGTNDDQIKAKKKLINSAIGKIRYKVEKENTLGYLNSLGIKHEDLGLNAADLTKLNKLAIDQNVGEIYEYLDERERYNTSRVASMLSVEMGQVYPVVAELSRFLGPEFGSGNTQIDESLDGFIRNIGEVDKFVRIDRRGDRDIVRVNEKGRRVADQLLYDIAGQLKSYNLSPGSSLGSIGEIIGERIKLLKNTGSADSLVRILQSAKGKIDYRIWKQDFEFKNPYEYATDYRNAQTLEGTREDVVLYDDAIEVPGTEEIQLTQVVEVLSKDTESITEDTAAKLGLETQQVEEVTDVLQQTIFSEEKKEKRGKRSRIRTKVKMIIAGTLVLIGLGIVAKTTAVNASTAKEFAKNTFYDMNEKFGDDDCEALAAYVDDTGDYSILPGILRSWIPGGLSCRDVAPPDFVFISEMDNFSLDEASIPITNFEMPVEEVAPVEQEIEIPSDVEFNSPILETEGPEITEVNNVVTQNEEVEESIEIEASPEVVNNFVPRPVENITVSEEVRNQIQQINTVEDAQEFLINLSPEYLGTNIEKDPETGITYLYYSLPSEISSNEFIRLTLGSDLINLMGQKLPENTIAKVVYFPEDTKGMLTPGLWQGENSDLANLYYGTDAGSIIKAAGGGDKVLADFVLDWMWEGEKKEPFRPTNRIGEIVGSSFRAGDIAANTEFLCVDRQTGKWWVTNWENVPKDNPSVDVANLLWVWTDKGNFNPDPTVGNSSFRGTMQGKHNHLRLVGAFGVPAQGTTFRSVTDSKGVTRSQVIYSNTFLSIKAPYIFAHILGNSPVIDSNGNPMPLSDESTIHAGSPDQQYIYGLMPEKGIVRDISGSQPFESTENYGWVNNIVGFAITNGN